MYIYICYHFTDTRASTLTRRSAKTVKDIILKLSRPSLEYLNVGFLSLVTVMLARAMGTCSIAWIISSQCSACSG